MTNRSLDVKSNCLKKKEQKMFTWSWYKTIFSQFYLNHHLWIAVTGVFRNGRWRWM